MRILVQRMGALGDVILTTPIIRRLRSIWGADVDIYVNTGYPYVFRDHPHIKGINPNPHMEFDQRIMLDGAYETRPNMHIVIAYMQSAFGDNGNGHSLQPELFYKPRPMFSTSTRRYVAVHAAMAGWRNRTLPRETWIAIIEGIQRMGLWPILIGTPRDDLDRVLVTKALIPDIHMQANLIAHCAAFVGSDSGLLHVAACTQTPIVGIFTSVRWNYRLQNRRTPDGGALDWAVEPAGLDCLGCQERAPLGSTTESCERGDIACVTMVRPETVLDVLKIAVMP